MRTTMRRTGAWCVELIVPIEFRDGTKSVEAVELRPPNFDQSIRWNAGEIPSVLALIAELSGLSEATLRKLDASANGDMERVMMALYQIVPGAIRESLQKGTRPMVVRAEPAEESIPRPNPPPSPFPKAPAGESVVEFSELPKFDEGQGGDGGVEMNVSPPPVMRKVR